MILFIQVLGILCIIFALLYFMKGSKIIRQEANYIYINHGKPIPLITILILLWLVASFLSKMAMIVSVGMYVASLSAIVFSAFLCAASLGRFLAYIFGRTDSSETDKWGAPIRQEINRSMFSLSNLIIMWFFADYYSLLTVAGYDIPELIKQSLLNII
ncbi:MAG: hypothetical protein WC788_01410 [Candidatus Paceibacterota bacterium]|jgi:hypothetical protein